MPRPSATTEELTRARAALEAECLAAGVEYGRCLCGCGLPTRVPTETQRHRNWFPGIPLRWVNGHKNIGTPPHAINEKLRQEIIAEIQSVAIDRQVPLGWCMCGCGARTSVAKRTAAMHRLVEGFPTLFLRGHQRRTPMMFHVVEPPDWLARELGPCLLWMHGVTAAGYAEFYWDGEVRLVHRVVYEAQRGPIPDGFQLDHLCRRHPCLSPLHTEPVTMEENVRRGREARRLGRE